MTVPKYNNKETVFLNMARRPNYEKWYNIYLDSRNGLKWDELVKKHKTSRRTINNALKFFQKIESNSGLNKESREYQIYLAQKEINKLKEKIEYLESDNSSILKELKSLENNPNPIIMENERIIKIFNSLQITIRLKILMILYVYNELSLSNLSKKLDVSKSTVARHIKKLMDLGLIKIREEKVRSPRMKQYFSASPDLFEMTRLSNSILKDFPKELAFEARLQDINIDSNVFSLLRKMLDEAMEYNKKFLTKLKDVKPKNHRLIQDLFSSKNICKYYIWNLDQEEFEVYKKNLLNFLFHLTEDFKILRKERANSKTFEKPYFILNLIIPLKKILDTQEFKFDFI